QVQEMKDGKKIEKEQRTMPGYLLVNMNLTDDSWGLVKNTPGVTGFVGPSQKPMPLSQPVDLRDQRGRRQAQGAGIHLRARDSRRGRFRPGEEDLTWPRR
ncbi:MAG TPA: transcription termination/antitermination NusG family protein, partial [Solirubrobacterales bacterium]|nr:transcription termination/antitermination NusG family protein [Solirubrobacterales bacterium]